MYQTNLFAPESLAAAYALHAFTLYDYACPASNGSSVLRVQLVCHSKQLNDLFPLLNTVLWCGQMESCPLQVRIVSDNEAVVRAEIMKRMPLLQNFSNLGSSNRRVTHSYVQFDFQGTLDAACKWTAILMDTEQTTSYACSCIPHLSDDRSAVLHLNCLKKNLPADIHASLLAKRKLNFLQNTPPSTFSEQLKKQALLIHLSYLGTNDGHTHNNIQDLNEGSFGYSSSAAAALHIPYKLKDVGIDPRRSRSDVAKNFTKHILREPQRHNFYKLIALEHRRWMMYHIVFGWRTASIENCDDYCFCVNDELKAPCYKFKIEEKKLHPALVPSTANQPLAALLHNSQGWDAFNNDIDIANIPIEEYDPLDKVSLTLHWLAREKMEAGKATRSHYLRKLHRAAERHAEALKAFDTFKEWYTSEGCSAHSRRTEEDQFTIAKQHFENCGIDAENIFSKLRTELKIVNEYYSYNDFKQADVAMIEQMGYIYCRPDQLTLITMQAPGMLDNFAPPLLVSPDKLIMFGMGQTEGEVFHQIYKKYARIAPFEFALCPCAASASHASILGDLQKCVDNELHSKHACVIDVTGAPAAFIAAAIQLRHIGNAYANVGIITCDRHKQQVQNLEAFPLADTCCHHVSLSVKDIMGLHNARPTKDDRSDDSRYHLLRMKDSFAKVWDFSHHQNYDSFFTLMNKNRQTNLPVAQAQTMVYTREVILNDYSAARLNRLLEDLKHCKAIADWNPLVPTKGNFYNIVIRHYHVEHLLDAIVNHFSIAGAPPLRASLVGSACVIHRLRFLTQRSKLKDDDQLSTCTLPSAFLSPILGEIPPEKPDASLPYKVKRKKEGFTTIAAPTTLVNLLETAWKQIENTPNVRITYDTSSESLYLVMRKNQFFSENMHHAHERTLLRRIFTNAHVEEVLNNIKQEYTAFTWRCEPDLYDPSKVTVYYSGSGLYLSIVDQLMDKLTQQELPPLEYNHNLHIVSVAETPRRSVDLSGTLHGRDALLAAEAAGVISNLQCPPDATRATFDINDINILPIFEKNGNLLEYYAWYAAYHARFDDVQNDYSFHWGDAPNSAQETSNELDVLITKGMQLMLVSCKDKDFASKQAKDDASKQDKDDASRQDKDDTSKQDKNESKFNVYEIRLLADQFSHDTVPVLLHRTNTVPSNAIKSRADALHTHILVLSKENKDHLLDGSSLSETFIKLMK